MLIKAITPTETYTADASTMTLYNRNGTVKETHEDRIIVNIPEWQRRIKLARAYAIGNNYNKYKWNVHLKKRLICSSIS